MKKVNWLNKKIGRLLVVREIGAIQKNIGSRKRVFWECKCDCGNTKNIQSSQLLRTKSCGCLNKEKIGALNYKHGEAKKTKENRAWHNIKSRCYCKTNNKYENYGGRGIGVCDRWLNSYEDFLLDMGRSPKNMSIHRIDNNGNYEPSNCKWATNKEQANETTRSVFIEYLGLKLTLKQWSEKLGYSYKTFHKLIKYKNKTIKELSYGRI